MSSVTYELTYQSPLVTWFDKRINQRAAMAFVNHQNREMERTPCLTPPGGTDYLRVGMAMIYGVAWSYTDMQHMVYHTPAYQAIKKLADPEAFITSLTMGDTVEKQAEGCYQLACFDSAYRNGKSEIGFMREGSIQDIANLLERLPDQRRDHKRAHMNCTFEGSMYLAGDANLIVDHMLVDVRTTITRRPFTLKNLYQQLTYLLMDYTDEYQIRGLTWFYTRQQTILSYPVQKLVSDLEHRREEFYDFLVDFSGKEDESFSFDREEQDWF